MTKEWRGSRKHILDLVSSGRAAETLTGLLAGLSAPVQVQNRIRPLGHVDPGEWDLRGFCRNGSPSGVDLQPLNNWWVSEDYTGPTWDLLAECTVRDRPGFLLVEAKAHESELHRQGKSREGRDRGSKQSQTNHNKIAATLAQTEEWFRANIHRTCAISVDAHYQLANRLSAAERLASCGVPVVLLYLGFTGDSYFRADYLRDPAHWQRVMGAYLEGVIPLWWPGTTTPHGQGSVTMLIASLPVQSISSRTTELSNAGDMVPTPEPANIVDPVVLIRVPQAFRAGMSDVALYEATRGVWKIGPRRDKVHYALAVYHGVIQEVYEIVQWQRAWTTPYTTRTFENMNVTGRWEFVGHGAPAPIRDRYLGKSVAHHFRRGGQNPITYVGVPE